MAKFIKSHSNYALRSRHQKTADGNIFERDFMTISSPDGYSPDSIPVYGESNFKFITRQGINVQKKHSRGSWVINNLTNSPKWTLSSLEESVESTESKVILKRNYNSIKDFAYYGSAIELIRSSVTDIIARFPAELYFSTTKFKVSGTTYYTIINEFGIDVDSEGVDASKVDNPLRYLTASINDYVLIGDGSINEICVASCSVEHLKVTCQEEEKGAIVSRVRITHDGKNHYIYVYSKQGRKKLLYDTTSGLAGWRLKPKFSLVEDFWASLDEFQSIILNRDSNPVYMAVFDTPELTSKGYVTSKKSYTWPNKNGYNPDITSTAYEQYMTRLMELAEYHDEFDSDNIWRSMTHESIKTLDWTYKRERNGAVEEHEELDTSRIRPILRLYGRSYDNLKSYIDGISTINNISYDAKNNMPDYMLTDALENSGFEIKVVNPTTDNSKQTPVLFKGEQNGYNAAEVNVEFLRRLKLNAQFLLSEKGTRKGVEDMLGLFGFTSGSDYEISEYVEIAQPTTAAYPTISNVQVQTISGIKYPYYGYIKYLNQRKDNYDAESEDGLYGLPLKAVSVTKNNVTATYVVPWFSKNKTYDEDLYFQMMGGWGYSPTKMFSNSIAPDITSIASTAEFPLFDEDIGSLKFAENLDMMADLGNIIVKEKDICYVFDISNIDEKYSFKDGESSEGFSHYFILENADYSSIVGYVEGDAKYGWKNVKISEIETNTGNGTRVLYLESIVDNTKGNAPHAGHNRYDRGESYLQRMANPFSAAKFSMLSDEDALKASSYKFILKEIKDEQKCWYFEDTSKNNIGLKNLSKTNGKYTVAAYQPSTSIGIQAYNPESNVSYDEAAANSVINTKKITISFNTGSVGNSGEMRNYIEKVVLFYVKQMIPSTAILEYEIN